MPRDVSNPSRRSIFDISGLVDFIDSNDKVNDCFISVFNDSTYDHSGFKRVIPEDQLVIDKCFFEFDNRIGHNPAQPMAVVLEESKLIAKWLIAKGYQIVILASGKKGIHIHCLLSPKTYKEPKKVLRNFAMYVVESASDSPLKTLDTHVLGDVRRICRVPHTSRPPLNSTYCTFIPQQVFLSMTVGDLYNWTHQRYFVDDFQIRQKTYENTLDEYIDYKPRTTRYYNSVEVPTPSGFEFSQLTEVQLRLKAMLRPCLFTSIIDKDPRHHIRAATTIDLLGSGMSSDNVVELFSALGWTDYKFEKTNYYVNEISSKNYTPYSCSRIRELGCKNNGRCCF